MTVSKRHHYTPRYYLKRFETKAGALWRLDSETGKITKGNNARFGFKKRWNSLRNPPPGYAPDWAEKQIAVIDGMASKVITEILEGQFPADIRKLAMAISFMHHNQPRLRRELETVHPDKVGHWSEDYWLVVRLKTALDNWENYVPLYYALNVIPPDSDQRFLTSSNPLIDFTNKPTMLLPLSSRHCLFLSNDPAHRNFGPVTRTPGAEEIAGINRMTIKNAWQYLYSSTESFAE
jgi:hypothetical protein